MVHNTITKYKASTFFIEHSIVFKRRLLNWLNAFDPACYLDGNAHAGRYDVLAGVGANRILPFESGRVFDQLKKDRRTRGGWLFGYLGYDLKNEIEELNSSNQDGLNFPEVYFFEPLYVLGLRGNQLHIYSQKEAPEDLFEAILSSPTPQAKASTTTPVELKPRMSPDEYRSTVSKIKEHILEGDLYEMNFCQEFYADNCAIKPLHLFDRLNQIAKAPFASYFKQKEQYLIGASPERFLKKVGGKLMAQPIKGTIRRGRDANEDQMLKQQLFHSEKDRAENVMIVDLVRNDLAKSCLPGTIHVPELFGIHAFEQVHQMISTVEGHLDPKTHYVDAIKNAFPMGSMTGAPKVISMELIEEYEQTKRGIYSGAVGYFTPWHDFDFNVVIRSFCYNSQKQYLSYQVGGAIVYDSDPQAEYEECLLKASGLEKALRRDEY